jgi:hypothetical protein
MTQTTASQLHWRLVKVKERLFRLHKPAGDYSSDLLRKMGEVSILDMALEDALHGRFPAAFFSAGYIYTPFFSMCVVINSLLLNGFTA